MGVSDPPPMGASDSWAQVTHFSWAQVTPMPAPRYSKEFYTET